MIREAIYSLTIAADVVLAANIIMRLFAGPNRPHQ